MAQRPVILFDVMDTLVTDPYYEAMPAFFGMSFDDLRMAVHPTSWIEFEEGRITEAEYLARFFRDGRSVDAQALIPCLRNAYRWIEGMKELLADLKTAGYEMHVLSNYSTWYQLIEEKLQLSEYVHWSFVSCLTGVRKPDPQAYFSVTKSLQFDVRDCLLVDDRIVNVGAARDVGMDAILAESAAQIRAELARRGIP